MAVLGVFSTGAGYVLFFGILGHAGTTNVTIVTLLIPVWAVLLSSLVLGEILHAIHLGGMALISLGLAAIDGRSFQWLTNALLRTKLHRDGRIRPEESSLLGYETELMASRGC